MKKCNLLINAWFLFTFIMVSGWSHNGWSQVVLHNPGLEIDAEPADGWPDGYLKWSKPGTVASYLWDSTFNHTSDGEHSVRIEISDVEEPDTGMAEIYTYATGVNINKSYEFSAYVKTEDAPVGAGLCVGWKCPGVDGFFGEFTCGDPGPTGTTDWTKLSLSVVPPVASGDCTGPIDTIVYHPVSFLGSVKMAANKRYPPSILTIRLFPSKSNPQTILVPPCSSSNEPAILLIQKKKKRMMMT